MKNKKYIIPVLLLCLFSIGFITTYGFYYFYEKSEHGMTLNAGLLDVKLTSSDSINLTNTFPMSYDEAYAANNAITFKISSNVDLSEYLYYGIKIVPTEENTMPLEYISFDISLYNEDSDIDYYGDYESDYKYILRNTKLSEYDDKFVYCSYLTSNNLSFIVRVWINDDCIIGNTTGTIDPSVWANLVTSVKVTFESSEEKNGYEPVYAYLNKPEVGSNKFLTNEGYVSFIATKNSTYNSVQDSKNYEISYIYPYNSNFWSKASNIRVIKFEQISTTKLNDILNNKTLNVDYFDHTDSTLNSGHVIGYFEELYSVLDGYTPYYSYNIVSDKVIMFPKDAANLFEYASNTYTTNTTAKYRWDLYKNTADTYGVTNYFEYLQEIIFDNIDTRNTVDFGYMFQNLTKITSLDLSKFNTSIAKRMSGMFLWNSALTELDLTNLDTSRATRMDWMFAGTNIVQTDTEKHYIGLEDLDVSKVQYLDNIFTFCTNIKYLDLSNWKTGELAGFVLNNVTASKTAFVDAEATYGYYNYCHYAYSDHTSRNPKKTCYTVGGIMGGNTNDSSDGTFNNLKYLDISNFDVSKLTSLDGFFRGYTNLETLKIDNWDTSNISNFNYLLFCCTSLKNFDISILNTSNATSMVCTFANFGDSTFNYDFSKLDTSKVTDFKGTFAGLTNITTIDLSNLDTSSATIMNGMFRNCTNLVSLDLSNFDFSNCLSLGYFFLQDTSLTTITFADDVDLSKCSNFMYTFGYCSELVNVDFSHIRNSAATTLEFTFINCSKLTNVDLSGFTSASITDMFELFWNCTSLISVDISNLDTSLVTKMSYMFRGCSNLKTIYVGNKWSTTSVTVSTDMFYGCYNLVGGNGTRYNNSYTDATYAVVDTAATEDADAIPGYLTLKV